MRDRLKPGKAVSPLKGPPVDDEWVKRRVEAQDALAKAFAGPRLGYPIGQKKRG